jgi:hypothetical protein
VDLGLRFKSTNKGVLSHEVDQRGALLLQLIFLTLRTADTANTPTTVYRFHGLAPSGIGFLCVQLLRRTFGRPSQRTRRFRKQLTVVTTRHGVPALQAVGELLTAVRVTGTRSMSRFADAIHLAGACPQRWILIILDWNQQQRQLSAERRGGFRGDMTFCCIGKSLLWTNITRNIST